MTSRAIEIIPPDQRFQLLPGGSGCVPAPLVSMPMPPPRGFFARLRYERDIWRETEALALYHRRAQAEQEYWDSQTRSFESALKCQEAAYRLTVQGELLALLHASKMRELQRGDELAELQHQRVLADGRLALEEIECRRAALQDYGQAIARQQRENDLIDLELAAEERRAVLRQHLREINRDPHGPSESRNSMIDDALHAARAEMNASGLDTSRLDAVIEHRKMGG